MEDYFYSEEITEKIRVRIYGKSYKENCDVLLSDLRYIQILHMGFDRKEHIGEIIVNRAISDDMVEILKELYDLKYPIERMVLVDDYDADDIKSMEANNSSAFNFRFIDGTTKRSLHSDGLAIDINPLYNPYVRNINGKLSVLPESGLKYADRTMKCDYYISAGDSCYQAFTKRGFTWGGDWKKSKDYQHFEKNLKDLP